MLMDPQRKDFEELGGFDFGRSFDAAERCVSLEAVHGRHS
jgi:hypothetical protein